MRFVETSGRTVDEAITAALLELGLPCEDVEIEVEVEIEDAVDYILKQKPLVASGDAIILDNCDKWFNLVKLVIDENIGPFPYIDICPR